MSDYLERVTAFVEAWESHDADHNCRSGYIMPPRPKMGLAPGGVSLDRDDLRALVADAKQLRAQGTEYGIDATFASTRSATFTVADTLGDALKALEEFDAKRSDVACRQLVERPVGKWRKVGGESMPQHGGKPWRLRYICCGSDDGESAHATWADADHAREAYVAAGSPSGNNTHERQAILTGPQQPETGSER